MMALESTTNLLDRSMSKLRARGGEQPPVQRRRWSLYGTKDTPSIKTPPPPPPAPVCTLARTSKIDSDKEKRKRSRSVDMSPLQASMKKAPVGLSAKLSQCVDALGLRDAVHRYQQQHSNNNNSNTSEGYATPVLPTKHSSKGSKHVHFPSTLESLAQECEERPETTETEKRRYHYTHHELAEMVLDAKESLARETHFCTQPDGTIFEQGFLTFPNELHFFHHKRYYCLLKSRGELVCYASPAHATRNMHVKCRLSLIKVQECSSMSMQAKIGAFGAHLPSSLSLLFFVTKADGERVLLSAETRALKKSWVYTLSRMTQAHEATALPLPRALRQSSTASTCPSEQDDAPSLEEEEPESCGALCGEKKEDGGDNNSACEQHP